MDNITRGIPKGGGGRRKEGGKEEGERGGERERGEERRKRERGGKEGRGREKGVERERGEERRREREVEEPTSWGREWNSASRVINLRLLQVSASIKGRGTATEIARDSMCPSN